jgi:hypothetical protein
LRSAAGCVKPRWPLLESLLLFCTGCGSKAANSSGHQRRPINLHSRTTESRRSAGTNVPAGTLALVRSLLALRCSREQNALHTLIHQRHLTPSCRGQAPTAERTLDPARMFTESLNLDPELENIHFTHTDHLGIRHRQDWHRWVQAVLRSSRSFYRSCWVAGPREAGSSSQ